MKRSVVLPLVFCLALVLTWVIWPRQDPAPIPAQDTPSAEPPPLAAELAPQFDLEAALGALESVTDSRPIRELVDVPDAIPIQPHEIGFYGQVLSTELPIDHLWVRLNVLSLSPELDQTCDPEDYTTWAFDPGILRSRPKRLEDDGSFELLGKAPGLVPGSLRRYVIEIAMDPPGNAWPLLGKDELLPVAMQWVNEADAGTVHGPYLLETQAPHRIRTQVELELSMEWARPGIGVQLDLSRLEDPPRVRLWADSNERVTTSPDRRAVSAMLSATSSASDFYLAAVSPDWQAQTQLHLVANNRLQAVQRVSDAQRVDQDLELRLRMPSLCYALARISTPLEKNSYLRARYFNGGAPLKFDFDSSLYPETLRTQSNSTIEGDANPTSTFNIPRAEDPQSVFDLPIGALFTDEWGAWCAIGWLPPGKTSIEVTSPSREQVWSVRDFPLNVGQIEQITLDVERTSRQYQLVFPEGFLVDSSILLAALDEEGDSQYLDLDPFFEARTDPDALPIVELPMGSRSLAAVRNLGSGSFQFCSANIPVGASPPAKILLRSFLTRSELSTEEFPDLSGSYSLRSASFGSNEQAPGVRTILYGQTDRFILLGLPPGDYILKNLLELSSSFDPFWTDPVTGEPAEASAAQKSVEFRVER